MKKKRHEGTTKKKGEIREEERKGRKKGKRKKEEKRRIGGFGLFLADSQTRPHSRGAILKEENDASYPNYNRPTGGMPRNKAGREFLLFLAPRSNHMHRARRQRCLRPADGFCRRKKAEDFPSILFR